MRRQLVSDVDQPPRLTGRVYSPKRDMTANPQAYGFPLVALRDNQIDRHRPWPGNGGAGVVFGVIGP
jgi:hypothetical protein